VFTVKRLICLTIAACALAAAAAPGAYASDNCDPSHHCHWFSGSLAKDFGWGSVEAHSLNYVEGDAYNDLICIGTETGNAGSYYDAPFFSDCQAYSSGGVAHQTYTPSCCFHATVIYSGPASSKTILAATHYDY
jgi:hypothetical protein